MKIKLTKEDKRKIWKVVKILLIIFVIYISWAVGRLRGTIDGLYVATKHNNQTICDLINKERDVDGFCLLDNETHKYELYLDCSWEKFKLKGERRPPLVILIAEDLRKLIFYPAMGCYS